jgi:hypothetical protein
MKKLLIISAFFLSALSTFAAPPAKGGYLGHRIIVAGDFMYAPFFTSFKDFYTKYDLQYGGNIHVITGRRTQIGLSYNVWTLRNNQVFNSNLVKSDLVKGYEYGLTVRRFRKKRGGLAPIGKFWDLGLSYAHNEFKLGGDKIRVLDNNEVTTLPRASNFVIANIAFGTQMVFWDRLVANTGIRMGFPFKLDYEGGSYYSGFMNKRMIQKEVFGVFFGLGVLI